MKGPLEAAGYSVGQMICNAVWIVRMVVYFMPVGGVVGGPQQDMEL